MGHHQHHPNWILVDESPWDCTPCFPFLFLSLASLPIHTSGKAVFSLLTQKYCGCACVCLAQTKDPRC